jgi:DNA-binding PadR family transcriptional regulator
MFGITESEAVILGMLVDAPKYAYEMEGIIEEQSMRDWTEIAFSSIYAALKNLETKRFVTSETRAEKNRTRKIYTITAAGLDILKSNVQERISSPQSHKWAVDIGLAYLDVLSAPEVIGALKTYRTKLEEFIKCYHDLEHFLADHDCPLNRKQLALRPLHLYQAEINWVEEFLRQYETENTKP